MKKNKIHTLLKYAASAITAVAVLFLLQRLVIPKYADDVTEGAMVAEYYDEYKDHDVIFIGDCEVYENFTPATLWEEYGINSYIRGSAQQCIWQSYYLLEDTLRYETPDAVVFNVQSLQYDKPQNEAYNRMTLDGMNWSPSKVAAVKASMTPEEHFADYVFPLLRYHSRWSELDRNDFKYMFKKNKVTYNGYYMRVDVKPAENVPDPNPLSDYSFGKNALKYLNKMTALCEAHGIDLILIKAPSLWPYWYEEWNEQAEEYAEKNGLLYINFLEHTGEIGLDYNTDTYDAGLHMNLSGAQKCSRYIGGILKNRYALKDRRKEKDLSRRWEQKLSVYEAAIHKQYKDLEAGK